MSPPAARPSLAAHAGGERRLGRRRPAWPRGTPPGRPSGPWPGFGRACSCAGRGPCVRERRVRGLVVRVERGRVLGLVVDDGQLVGHARHSARPSLRRATRRSRFDGRVRRPRGRIGAFVVGTPLARTTNERTGRDRAIRERLGPAGRAPAADHRAVERRREPGARRPDDPGRAATRRHRDVRRDDRRPPQGGTARRRGLRPRCADLLADLARTRARQGFTPPRPRSACSRSRRRCSTSSRSLGDLELYRFFARLLPARRRPRAVHARDATRRPASR